MGKDQVISDQKLRCFFEVRFASLDQSVFDFVEVRSLFEVQSELELTDVKLSEVSHLFLLANVGHDCPSEVFFFLSGVCLDVDGRLFFFVFRFHLWVPVFFAKEEHCYHDVFHFLAVPLSLQSSGHRLGNLVFAHDRFVLFEGSLGSSRVLGSLTESDNYVLCRSEVLNLFRLVEANYVVHHRTSVFGRGFLRVLFQFFQVNFEAWHPYLRAGKKAFRVLDPARNRDSIELRCGNPGVRFHFDVTDVVAGSVCGGELLREPLLVDGSSGLLGECCFWLRFCFRFCLCFGFRFCFFCLCFRSGFGFFRGGFGTGFVYFGALSYDLFVGAAPLPNIDPSVDPVGLCSYFRGVAVQETG